MSFKVLVPSHGQLYQVLGRDATGTRSERENSVDICRDLCYDLDMKNNTNEGSRDVTRALRKRETRELLRSVVSSSFHLRNLLLAADDLDEVETLNEYLRHVLLRLEESAAAGRLLR